MIRSVPSHRRPVAAWTLAAVLLTVGACRGSTEPTGEREPAPPVHAAAYRGPDESPVRAAPDIEPQTEGAVVLEPDGPTLDLETLTPITVGVAAPTTSGLVCRDSFDPACGPFHWDPEVVNQPVDVSMEVSNPSPAAGEQINVSIFWSDGDADSASLDLKACRDGHCIEVLPNRICPGPSGGWTPPPTRGRASHFEATVVLPSLGEWVLQARVSTFSSGHVAWSQEHGSCAPDDPYASEGMAEANLVVSRLSSS